MAVINKPIPNQVSVALETLGCKLNQAETEMLARQLSEAGCRIVTSGDKVDIYILNTCTVTGIADRKSRHLLRLAHRRHPGACIVAVGCYAEAAPGELSEIEGVSLVIGNKDRPNLLKILSNNGFLPSTHEKLRPAGYTRTRSFLKIQDGCNLFCTYCIVPLVKGREKSLPPEEIIKEIQQRAAEGYQEVVLTGTEVGRYNYGGLELKGLLERVLKETGIRRIRLSSLQPQEISLELLDLWKSPRLCRHFHLSLQSGSDSVLRRMNRRYTALEFQNTLECLRSRIPGVAVTTDIIVGFPGESLAEHRESLDFCRRMKFSRIHVFPYSLRKGTGAAGMPVQVESRLKKERSDEMLSLAKSWLREYQSTFLGKIGEVLFEKRASGYWSGLTDNYLRVFVRSGRDLTGRLLPVRMLEIQDDVILGELQKENE